MNVLIILQRYNRDQFIYAPYDTPNRNYLMPIGLPFISAVLKEAGHQVNVLNLNHATGSDQEVIAGAIRAGSYDAVLLGGLSLHYPHIRDYITYIRGADRTLPIIVGGGLVTAQPEIMFDLLGADYLVLGEGEQTVIELLEVLAAGADPRLVDGIYYRGGKTKAREPIMDLDRLPFTDLESFGYAEYLDNVRPWHNPTLYDIVDEPRPYPILAARSCPFGCTFCFHPIGQKYRYRSIENIMDELKLVIPKYRINIVLFYDELFSANRERLMEFCRQFKEFTDTLPWKVHWFCNIRVDNVDDDLVKAMVAAGCHNISSGFESYSQAVLTSMRKHTTPAQIKRALTIFTNNRVGVQGMFIFGDTAETMATARETLDFYTGRQDIIRGTLQMGFVIPFQGSPIYRSSVESGIIKDEIAFINDRATRGYNYNEPVNLTRTLSDAEFEDLKGQVMTAHLTARPHSRVTASTGMGFTVRCPYCGAENRYGNMRAPEGFGTVNVGCRFCHGRFEATTVLYPLKVLLLNTIGFNTIYRIRKATGAR